MTGQRQGAESATVKTFFQGDDLALSRIRQARELERRLVRLGATVAEKRAQQSRSANEPFAEDSLRRVIEEVGHVQKRSRFFAKRLHQTWMLMSEDIDRDPAKQIPVFIPLGVSQPRSLAAARMKRRAGVRAQNEVLFTLFDCGRRFVMQQQFHNLLVQCPSPGASRHPLPRERALLPRSGG